MAFKNDNASLKQIRRADLDLDMLVDGLRGNVRLLEAQLAKALANTKEPMTPEAEALLRRKVARARYQLWGTSLAGVAYWRTGTAARAVVWSALTPLRAARTVSVVIASVLKSACVVTGTGSWRRLWVHLVL